ncbi:TPA: LysE family translocator [Serratia fonticola]|uniref:LysE family translocator n=1 Tax=Serratia fonticola TaxID=47917 RepID=UPI001378578B|nr:LysE family translocator [Serratia fonticola]MBC3216731.1 LysE family translocator [Serratia fonticola]NBJ33191.1 LysE family transporter [Serratia fonticola]
MLDSAFISYVTVMSITPGPNNLLLASSGVNFGLRRTLPMVFGISLGCAIQLALTTLLLALILNWADTIRFPLAVMGCAYLLWLSWKLYKAASPDAKQQARPMHFIGGALFQAVNPKAWLMAINVAILFTPHEGASLHQTLLTIAGFTAVNIPCILIWALMGDRLRHALRVTWKLRLFNGVMAGLMAATALWLLFDEWRTLMA